MESDVMPCGSSSAGIGGSSAPFGSTSWTSPRSTIASHLDCVGSAFIRSAYSSTLDIDSADTQICSIPVYLSCRCGDQPSKIAI